MASETMQSDRRAMVSGQIERLVRANGGEEARRPRNMEVMFLGGGRGQRWEVPRASEWVARMGKSPLRK